MVEHRMVGGEIDLAGDPDALPLGGHALELDALAGLVDLGAVEQAEEIEMPPGAAELAVGGELEADLLLLPDDLLDLAVLDLAQFVGAYLARLALRPRLLDRRGAQDAADMVGAERRLVTLHRTPPGNTFVVLASAKRRRGVPSTTKSGGTAPTSPSRRPLGFAFNVSRSRPERMAADALLLCG